MKNSLVVFFALCLMASPVSAEEYPARGVTIVVPAGAGGGADLSARVLAEGLTKELGQPFQVVNKPGGGTILGASSVVKESKPDGYTLLLEVHSSSSMLVGGMVNPPINLEDRTWVSLAFMNPIAFAVTADAPWKTFEEFGKWVKTNPTELTWSSIGPSGLSAFSIQDWLAVIGTDGSKTRMVPTKGAADSLIKLAGGHVILASHTAPESYALHQAGKIRILAISADERVPYLPDVPTAKEEGIEGLTVKWWAGLTGPAGMPGEIVTRLDVAIQKLIQDPSFQKKAKSIYSTVHYLGPKEFKDFVYAEGEYYKKLAKEIGVRK